MLAVTRRRWGTHLFYGMAIAAVIAAAWLRFRDLGGPSLWLDEILHHELAVQSLAQPLVSWLVGFEFENGPLFYALQLPGLRFADLETGVRVAAAVLGTLTVAWWAFAARRLVPRGILLSISVLLAASPLHVYYSREGRPYALEMLLATVVTAAFLRGSRRRQIGAAAVACPLLAYTAATTAPFILATALASGLMVIRHSRRKHEAGSSAGRRPRLSPYAFVMASALASLALMALLYGRFERTPAEAGFGGFRPAVFTRVANGLFSTATELSTLSLLSAAGVTLAAFGAWCAVRRRRALGVSLAVLPGLTIASSLATLAALDHWLSVRYLAPALPGVLALVAFGIEGLSERAGRVASGLQISPQARRGIRRALSLLIPVAVAAAALPAAKREAFQKPNWREAALELADLRNESEPVLAANQWSRVCLSYYMKETDAPLQVSVLRGDSVDEEGRLRGIRRAWIVAGGFPYDPKQRSWLRQFPRLWSSPFENAEIRFYPDHRSLLDGRRGSRWERRLVSKLRAAGGAIEFGAEAEDFLGSGWSGAESSADAPTYRWIEGTAATLLVPVAAIPPEALRMRVLPLDLSPNSPQTLIFRSGGRSLPPIVLAQGWSVYEVTLPADAWKVGVNLLEIELAWAAQPPALEGRSPDTRRLSVAFDYVQVPLSANIP